MNDMSVSISCCDHAGPEPISITPTLIAQEDDGEQANQPEADCNISHANHAPTSFHSLIALASIALNCPVLPAQCTFVCHRQERHCTKNACDLPLRVVQETSFPAFAPQLGQGFSFLSVRIIITRFLLFQHIHSVPQAVDVASVEINLVPHFGGIRIS
jgi:hypothetical protein